MKGFFILVVMLVCVPAVNDGIYLIKDESMLSQVKVAIIYQHIMDGIPPDRTLDDITEILNETKTDFVIRAAFKWYAMPEEFYEKFGDAVEKIKEKKSDVIICASFGAQFIDKRGEYDPIKREILNKEEVKEMAINLSRHPEWNLTEEQVRRFWEIAPLPEHEKGYFPDLTNKKFQELAVNIAKRLIDEGADAIWIDGLQRLPAVLALVTGDVNHVAVRDTFEGGVKIVEGIKEYAREKGKEVYIGTWVIAAFFPFECPKFDFLTFTPSAEEVLNMEFDEERWDVLKEKVEEKFGEIPIYVYIDYGLPDDTPMAYFSQKLSPNEQREFLKKIDLFSARKGMNFVYPVHGFYMGRNAKILSFGKYPIYDSLAPEFETYETIKELARNKAEGRPFVEIERPKSYIYIFDREILPCALPLIIGKITIKVDAFDLDGIEKVEFYIDDSLKFTDYETPYEWLWNERIVGFHMIRIIAYDAERKYSEEEIKVLIFNFG